MAFHVPFNQRHQQYHPAGSGRPIYIGFDVPAPRLRPKFNWWGFHGLWLSVASLMSAGFLSPIPLLVSLIGLRRPGKKMALLGTVTSLIGIGLAMTIVMGILAARDHHRQSVVARSVSRQVAKTTTVLATAVDEFTEYRDDHAGHLPDEIDANMLAIKHVDAWGESLRFDAEVDHAVIRSAGPDRQFDTPDDVLKAIKGKTERTRLLPIKAARQ